MKNVNRKFWLTAVVLLCLAPAAFAAKPAKCGWGKRCQSVPEGGSALVYVLGAGITCMSAVFIRSRAVKPE